VPEDLRTNSQLPSSGDLLAEIEQTRRAIGRALSDPPLFEVAAALEHLGVVNDCDRLVAAATMTNATRESLRALRARVAAATPTADGAFERVLLLRQFGKALPLVPSLPVSDDVKRLFCEVCRTIIAPPKAARFGVTSAGFAALLELSAFRRFPGGQFNWTISGIPRSWVLTVNGRDRWTLIYWIARKFKGFGPAFEPHLNAYRRNRWLLEVEGDRSYYRMAEALLLQPQVKGLIAASWLRSPDTHRVSPELAWVNRTIVENGGVVLTVGPADPNSGVLARSTVRKALYEAGRFKPTMGLVIWPRDAMISWAERHPELAVPSAAGAAPGAGSAPER
jgi:hypothetical protein